MRINEAFRATEAPMPRWSAAEFLDVPYADGAVLRAVICPSSPGKWQVLVLYLGGTGGQADFVRAGARSPGGRSIIALPATAQGGKVSRITASLAGPVTTARSDVDVIITEFGAAELKGQPLGERARRLTAIAHPGFQEELDRAAHTIQQRGF